MSSQHIPASATTFFRGISARLAAQDSTPTPTAQAVATAAAAPSPSTTSTQISSGHLNGTYNNNNAGTGQVMSYLLTQVAQPTGGGGSSGGGNDGHNDRRDNHSNGQTSQQQRGGGGAGSDGGGGGGGGSISSMTQRVHASALIERARYIRNQPKNTSPIVASAHPSLLPPQDPKHHGKKTLILDVDETLVHSSYQGNGHYDVHLSIDMDDGSSVSVYVAFRPFLHQFLRAIKPLFEVVIFTASMAKYCNPLMDSIDQENLLGNLRLVREHCSSVGGTFVKDLSLLGRNLDQVAIIDNSPVAYLFQQRNAIPITSWFDDPDDTELERLIPVLEALAEANTVYDVLDNYNALLQLQQQQTGDDGF